MVGETVGEVTNGKPAERVCGCLHWVFYYCICESVVSESEKKGEEEGGWRY